MARFGKCKTDCGTNAFAVVVVLNRNHDVCAELMWKCWKVQEKKLHSLDIFGIILNIEVEKRTGREIYVAYILRSDTDSVEKVNVLRLKKKETI